MSTETPTTADTECAVRDAAEQLTRYGEVADPRILEVLHLLTEINDDLCNGRAKPFVRASCENARALLSAIADDSDAT